MVIYLLVLTSFVPLCDTALREVGGGLEEEGSLTPFCPIPYLI